MSDLIKKLCENATGSKKTSIIPNDAAEVKGVELADQAIGLSNDQEFKKDERPTTPDLMSTTWSLSPPNCTPSWDVPLAPAQTVVHSPALDTVLGRNNPQTPTRTVQNPSPVPNVNPVELAKRTMESMGAGADGSLITSFDPASIASLETKYHFNPKSSHTVCSAMRNLLGN